MPSIIIPPLVGTNNRVGLNIGNLTSAIKNHGLTGQPTSVLGRNTGLALDQLTNTVKTLVTTLSTSVTVELPATAEDDSVTEDGVPVVAS